MTNRILLSTFTLFVLAVLAGRLYSRKSASDFGGGLAGALSTLNDEGFADTKGLREFLASPEMAKYPAVVRRFSLLGGSYDRRMNEVQAGLIYLSEQMSLPRERRFARPPALRYFKIQPDTSTDRSVFDAATKLVLDYRRQIL